MKTEYLEGRTVLVIENENNSDVSGLIARVLCDCWALVLHGSESGDFVSAKTHLAEKWFAVITECGTNWREILPQDIVPWAILWFYLGKKEETNAETSNIPQSTINLYDTSPNDVAKKVDALMELTDFHLPDWLTSSSLTIKIGGVEDVFSITWQTCLGSLQKIEVQREIEDGRTYTISCELFLDKKGKIFQRWIFQLDPVTDLNARVNITYWTRSHGYWNDIYPTKILLQQMEQGQVIQPIVSA